jgi:hypothetical protein
VDARPDGVLGLQDVPDALADGMGAPTLDKLAAAIAGYRFGWNELTFRLSANPPEAPTGIEPVTSSSRAVERDLLDWAELQAARAVSVYRPLFEPGGGV